MATGTGLLAQAEACPRYHGIPSLCDEPRELALHGEAALRIRPFAEPLFAEQAR
jgi:hypothetical protein